MDIEPGDLVIGIMMGVFGLLGLYLASRALDDEMYVFGLSLAVFAGLFLFGMVRRHYDRVDEARAAARVMVDA